MEFFPLCFSRWFSEKISYVYPVVFFMPPHISHSISPSPWKKPTNAAISLRVSHRHRVKPKMHSCGQCVAAEVMGSRARQTWALVPLPFTWAVYVASLTFSVLICKIRIMSCSLLLETKSWSLPPLAISDSAVDLPAGCPQKTCEEK